MGVEFGHFCRCKLSKNTFPGMPTGYGMPKDVFLGQIATLERTCTEPAVAS